MTNISPHVPKTNTVPQRHDLGQQMPGKPPYSFTGPSRHGQESLLAIHIPGAHMRSLYCSSRPVWGAQTPGRSGDMCWQVHGSAKPVSGATPGVYTGSLRKAGPCFYHHCAVFTGTAIMEARARPWLPTNLSLAAFHDDKLLLRRGPGEHDLCVVLQNVV